MMSNAPTILIKYISIAGILIVAVSGGVLSMFSLRNPEHPVIIQIILVCICIGVILIITPIRRLLEPTNRPVFEGVIVSVLLIVLLQLSISVGYSNSEVYTYVSMNLFLIILFPLSILIFSLHDKVINR